MYIDKKFLDNLIKNIINSKMKAFDCELVLSMPKFYLDKINKYIKNTKLSFFRLFIALLREYSEDEETREECLQNMPIEYDNKFRFTKCIHMSRDAYDLLSSEAHRIRIDKKALAVNILILFISKKVKFKSEKLLSAIVFERLV